ncbi:MAG: TrmH family RNA methyltransferase [Actinomycetes bacterium]
MDLQQIGLQHPRIRQLRNVRDNGAPNHHGLFVAEGLWAHNVLLDQNASIEVFLWCPEAAYSAEALVRSRQAAARATLAYRVSPRVLARLAERDRPDGMISLVRLPRWDADSLSLGRHALVLVADAVEIPGNLGTLLRTLDACGGACLVLTNRRTRLSHPKVFRGSRGMLLRVPVLDLGEPDLAAAWLRDRGFTTYLATPGGAAVPYHDVRFPARTAVVVGNERYGISPGWFAHALPSITVPMLGAADSLNVSVSASILLYAARASVAGWATPRRPSVVVG